VAGGPGRGDRLTGRRVLPGLLRRPLSGAGGCRGGRPLEVRPGTAVTRGWRPADQKEAGPSQAVGAYRRSGVDLEAAASAVDLIREIAASATRPEVVGAVGGFAGMFDLG